MATESKQYISEAKTALRLNVSRRSLQRWRSTGDGPPWARLGLRRIGYLELGVDGWATARTFTHRAEEFAAKEQGNRSDSSRSTR